METLILQYYSDNKNKNKWKNHLKDILEKDISLSNEFRKGKILRYTGISISVLDF